MSHRQLSPGSEPRRLAIGVSTLASPGHRNGRGPYRGQNGAVLGRGGSPEKAGRDVWPYRQAGQRSSLGLVKSPLSRGNNPHLVGETP